MLSPSTKADFVTTSSRRTILDTWKDKESRHIVAAEHIKEGLAFQIHALREARELTQTALARNAKMAQERISVLEDPNYDFLPKIQTLLRLAEVFDVPLIVRFGTWAELLDWETGLSPEVLAPPNFDKDPNIKNEDIKDTANYVPAHRVRAKKSATASAQLKSWPALISNSNVEPEPIREQPVTLEVEEATNAAKVSVAA
jgi:transcriptional regulator with XRE-family HTH domain